MGEVGRSIQGVDLDPLLILYRDPVLIRNAFSWQYRTGEITAIKCKLFPRTTEDVILLIGEVIDSLGGK